MAQSTSKAGGSGTGGGRGGGSGGDGGGRDGADGPEDFPEGNSTGAQDGDVGTAFLDGVTFSGRAVQYVVVDGMAMLEGDILLGTVEDVAERTERRISAAGDPGLVAHSIITVGDGVRWPDCRVPYQISASLPDQARVTDAIAHWESRTRFRFVPRTPANAAQFPDWAEFVPSGGCSSFVGRQGGRQEVRLAPGCTTGNTIHEIGHLVGLWHEQSREDRDTFVRIEFANIEPAAVHNFNQHISDGDDVGAYDYGSIMHYPRTAFSRNGLDTVVPLTAGAVIGQRTSLSAGDIAAANSMCAAIKTPVKEIVKELPDEVLKSAFKDGVKDGVKDSIKDRIKDRPKEFTKELGKDLVKDRPKEVVFEGSKSIGDEVVTGPGGFGPRVNPALGGPGLRQPFVLATGQESAQAPQTGVASELDGLLAVLAEYNRLDAMGVLGPDDRTAWQQTATYVQQLLAQAGR